MNDFFEQVWFNNSIKSYAIVGGIILLVLLLKKYISRYIASLLFKVVHKVWGQVDKKHFISLVVQPLGLFLTIMVCIVSLHKLHFPQVLNFELYNITAQQIAYSIGTTLFIGSFFWFLMRIIDFIAIILNRKADLTHTLSDNQLIVFFRDFIKVVAGVIGVLMIFRFAFGYNVSSFLTGLSIVGAAIALALRESLENLIASFIIFFDKPFTTGDAVKVNNVTGQVEKIGLRSTRIRTEQKTFVTMPNKQMVDSVLDNLSLRTQRRAELKLELSLQTNTTQIKELTATAEKLLMRDEVNSSKVYFADITNRSYLVKMEYFTAPMDADAFDELQHDINIKMLQLLEKSGVKIATNSTSSTAADRIITAE
jgi:MscS family membrane protein